MNASYTTPTDDCVHLRSDTTDCTWPAQVMRHEGRSFLVIHADDLLLASMTTGQGANLAVLIMLESGTGRGHAQPQTPHEMREMAARLVKLADQFEAEATAAASTLLAGIRKAPR